MTSRTIFVLLLPLLALCACESQDAADQTAAPSDTADTSGEITADAIAEVNGVSISRESFDVYLAQKSRSQPGIEHDRQTALDEMVNMELIRQEAIEQGIDERAEVQAELDNQRTNLLVNTLLRERIGNLSFSDAQLREEYEAQIAQAPKTEYKARHILVETKKDAQTIVEQLDEGADFVELAVEKSIDPAGPQGGDLGWFHPNSMVPPFAEAVQQLEKGQHSREPVKTQFGWHVILLEDTRPMEPPPFEAVKDRMESVLVNEALQSYLDELRAESKIEIKDVPESPARQE